MQEDFLHYIWKHKKFDFTRLKSEHDEVIDVLSVGTHNVNSGPDFFNAKLRIGEQLWAGNVEIHVKSSDWFLHNHELDNAYDNVILHVVWEHDTDVYRKDNTVIPTLVLKPYLQPELLSNYQTLFNKQNKWINCENDFFSIDDFVLNNWLERLYFERLERKSVAIEKLLIEFKNDWEAVLFVMLAKNFGLKVNAEAFFSVAKSIDFSVIRKTQSHQIRLESLLFGQAGLLTNDIQNSYYLSMQKEYQFVKQKFQLNNNQVVPVQFFRLRPANFPTIRLSQLAHLYYLHQNLFSKLKETKTLQDFYDVLQVPTSTFWETHYTFDKESKRLSKNISKSFVDLLLINTIIPIKFTYLKQKGESESLSILDLISKIKSENNSIVEAFQNLRPIPKSALQSQSLIQLKTEYCNKNNCLKCSIGSALISKTIKK